MDIVNPNKNRESEERLTDSRAEYYSRFERTKQQIKDGKQSFKSHKLGSNQLVPPWINLHKAKSQGNELSNLNLQQPFEDDASMDVSEEEKSEEERNPWTSQSFKV